jgi:hypothetical protein
MESNNEEYIRIFAWALDFCRAFSDRPKIIKLLIRWFLGKYARRELLGLFEWLEYYSYDPTLSYYHKDMNYQKDGKKWRWG